MLYSLRPTHQTKCCIHLFLSTNRCFVDMRKSSGPTLTTVLSGALIFTFLANLVCYLLVWGKIQQVARNTAALGQSNQQTRYHGTARVLMLFVAAYMIQWWAYVTYSIWSLFANPHIVMFVLTVIFTNMGGVFNFVAYTFVRILMRNQNTKSGKEGPSPMAPKGQTSLAGSSQTISTEIESRASK